MSTKAYVVLRFGNTIVHLYRHWGGDPEITGTDILDKIESAPTIKERTHFHDGGYILRQMLTDSDGTLPQYQVVDGTISHGWDHGYEISQGGSHNHPGPWLIRYAKLDGYEILDDWVSSAQLFTVQEFNDFVQQAIAAGIIEGKVYDVGVRAAWERRFGHLRNGK